MKKFNVFFRGITLMLFLMSTLLSFSQNCEYTLEMNDSFGDGWNGAAIDVIVDGTTVLDNVSASGSQTILPFPVSDGSFVTAQMVNAGSFSSEVSWEVYDSEEVFVTSGGAFSSQSFFATCPAACPGQATLNGATVSADCANQQFYVDVDFASADAAFEISDGTNSYGITVGNGVNQVGPFDSGSTVNLTIVHSPDDCNFDIGPFTFICPPPNDDCGDAIEVACSDTYSGNMAAANTDGASCGFTNFSGDGVWHTVVGTGGEITLDTNGSTFDTRLALYAGSCAALDCIDSDDDGGQGLQSEITFDSNAGEEYLVYVAGFSSFTTTGAYNLTVDCACFVTIEGGDCQDVFASSFAPLASTTLTASGFGAGDLTYTWSDGQVGETITITPEASAVYEVTVSDASGCTSTAQTTVLVWDVSCSNGNGEQDKVTVCHEGNEICISANAVQAHLNHGDSIGSCDGPVVACDTPPLCDSTLKVPAAFATDIPRDIEISWGAATGLVAGYILNVGTTDGGGEIINDLEVGLALDFSLDGLLDFSTTYYVTVTPFNANGLASGCESSVFTTEAPLWISDSTPIECGETATPSFDPNGTVNDYLATCGSTRINDNPGLWYTLVGDGFPITASLCGSSFDTIIGVYEGDETAISCLAGNDDDCGLQSEVEFPTNAGETYYIYVTSWSSFTTSGTYNLSITCDGPPPPLQACADAVNIECGTTVSGTTVGFSSNPDLDFCGTTISGAPGRFYKLTGNGDTIDLSTCNAANYDTKLAVFSGSCSALSCIGGNDDTFGCSGFTTELSFNSEVGTDYFIYVTGFGSASGNYNLTVSSASCQPAPRASSDATTWNLYPNPATNGEVELDLTSYLNMDLEIQMMDYSGKMLINNSESNLQNPRYRMNTQNASSGLYFVRIVTNSGVSTKKLIISN